MCGFLPCMEDCSCPSDILGSQVLIDIFGSSHVLTKLTTFFGFPLLYTVPSTAVTQYHSAQGITLETIEKKNSQDIITV